MSALVHTNRRIRLVGCVVSVAAATVFTLAGCSSQLINSTSGGGSAIPGASAPPSGSSAQFCSDASSLMNPTDQPTDAAGAVTVLNSWDKLVTEAPPGLTSDVAKVDSYLHSLSTGQSQSGTDGMGDLNDLTPILEWYATNCVL